MIHSVLDQDQKFHFVKRRFVKAVGRVVLRLIQRFLEAVAASAVLCDHAVEVVDDVGGDLVHQERFGVGVCGCGAFVEVKVCESVGKVATAGWRGRLRLVGVVVPVSGDVVVLVGCQRESLIALLLT